MAKRAVVTGASSGIGFEMARGLAQEGYRLHIFGRNEPVLRDVARALQDAGAPEVVIEEVDLATPAGQEKVIEACSVEPLTALVNAAGFGLADDFAHSSIDEERQLVEVSVLAVLRICRAALATMSKASSGVIVNVSSTAGFGPVLTGGATYGAAKAWVTVFSESLDEWARGTGIRVHALCPGPTRTAFHSRAGIRTRGIASWRWLTSEQVAKVMLAKWGKGSCIVVPSTRYRVMTGLMRTVLPRRPRSLAAALLRGGF